MIVSDAIDALATPRHPFREEALAQLEALAKASGDPKLTDAIARLLLLESNTGRSA